MCTAACGGAQMNNYLKESSKNKIRMVPLRYVTILMIKEDRV